METIQDTDSRVFSEMLLEEKVHSGFRARILGDFESFMLPHCIDGRREVETLLGVLRFRVSFALFPYFPDENESKGEEEGIVSWCSEMLEWDCTRMIDTCCSWAYLLRVSLTARWPGRDARGLLLGVMAAPIISISSYSSEESVGSRDPQVILFGAIPVIILVIPEFPIVPTDPLVAPNVGTVSVISPIGVLDLVDYSSFSDSDPLKDSLPPAPDLPLVLPFLCSDDSKADGESEPADGGGYC
ncbi:hypothetical protein Tco_0997902 [Tanacetum coccineum]